METFFDENYLLIIVCEVGGKGTLPALDRALPKFHRFLRENPGALLNLVFIEAKHTETFWYWAAMQYAELVEELPALLRLRLRENVVGGDVKISFNKGQCGYAPLPVPTFAAPLREVVWIGLPTRFSQVRLQIVEGAKIKVTIEQILRNGSIRRLDTFYLNKDGIVDRADCLYKDSETCRFICQSELGFLLAEYLDGQGNGQFPEMKKASEMLCRMAAAYMCN